MKGRLLRWLHEQRCRTTQGELSGHGLPGVPPVPGIGLDEQQQAALGQKQAQTVGDQDHSAGPARRSAHRCPPCRRDGGVGKAPACNQQSRPMSPRRPGAEAGEKPENWSRSIPSSVVVLAGVLTEAGGTRHLTAVRQRRICTVSPVSISG